MAAGVDGAVRTRLEQLLGSARAAPGSAEMRGRLAIAYEVNGFADSALATYLQAASLDASEFRWPYFAALLLAKRGDLDAAVEQIDAALAIDDGYIPAWLWRGEWRREQGRLDEARAAYRRAQALDAGSPAVAGLAQVALREGEPALAVELLERANAEPAPSAPAPHVGPRLPGPRTPGRRPHRLRTRAIRNAAALA